MRSDIRFANWAGTSSGSTALGRADLGRDADLNGYRGNSVGARPSGVHSKVPDLPASTGVRFDRAYAGRTTREGVTVRIRALAIAALVFVVLAGLGIALGVHELADDLKLPSATNKCTVQAQGRVALDARQMANAATIAAVGVRKGMPERAVIVALATAFQESKLENLTGGDRDSVGLFQQRPSQGWGTPEQIRDPRYAARKFYDALRKVRGWEQMRVTDAAQRVQRSAYPEAYGKWEDESTVLTRALLGHATGAVSCTVPGKPAVRGNAAAAALSHGLRLDWGRLQTGSAGVVGLAVSAADQRSGWQYAHWLVSHAADHGVKRVRFAGLEWTAKHGEWDKVSEGQNGSVVAEVFGDS